MADYLFLGQINIESNGLIVANLADDRGKSIKNIKNGQWNTWILDRDNYCELIATHCNGDILENYQLAEYDDSKYNWTFVETIDSDADYVGICDKKWYSWYLANDETIDGDYFTDNDIIGNCVKTMTGYGYDCDIYQSKSNGKILGIKIIMSPSDCSEESDS